MSVIHTENLTKIYRGSVGKDRILALNNLSIQIEQGEIFGLLGPNGSGKTTFIKIILGLIKQSKGKISILGKGPRDTHNKNFIGYLPETPNFYEFMNPVELLDFYASLFNISAKDKLEKIDELLDLVGISKYKSLKIRNFSKGMVQRVGLAASLINNPKLLILDEPTVGLDPIGSLEIQNLLRKLRDKGMTIFLSSHLLSEVQESCDRVAILYKGELIKIGKLDDLLKRKDQVQFTLKGDSNIIKSSFEKFARDNNLNIEDISTPKETLKDLFVETIKTRRITSE